MPRAVRSEREGRGVYREAALAVVPMELALIVARGEGLLDSRRVDELVVSEEADREAWEKVLRFPRCRCEGVGAEDARCRARLYDVASGILH